MNFVAQVEDHLRDLGAEARKKHPGVKEASERAILQLRTLQNSYVTAVRKASADGGIEHPTTALFQSQDLLRPFLLAANYPNASPYLLDISLKGMTLLIENNAICPGDGIHMVRVWTIQAKTCAASLSNQNPKATAVGTTSGSWLGMLSSSTGEVVSSGQGTSTGKSKEASEKLALELLRCLLSLLEKSSAEISEEQWTASVALCCILGNVRVLVVQQAAKTALHQVLGILFSYRTSHAVETWNDLLTLASQSPEGLHGAFSQCKSSAPSPTLCLELLQVILRGAPLWFSQNLDKVEVESLRICKTLLEDITSNSFELVWRSYGLACAVLMARYVEADEPPETNGENANTETKESESEAKDGTFTNSNGGGGSESIKQRKAVILEMVGGIVRATEACRNNHDFEDGYVYSMAESSQQSIQSPNKQKPKHLVSLIPDSLLWRAGLSLETFYLVLAKEPALILSVAEAVSDFATVGASCRDHILQLVECSKRNHTQNISKPITPSLFRKAEEIQSAAVAMQNSENQKNPSQIPSTSCDMGEALWIAFHCTLELSRYVEEEASFAPSLAVLQHFLKRFPGSKDTSQRTLVGYHRLAHIIETGSALQRKALLASLCKLSLPFWGKHDAGCQLQDNHVEALMCLLKIIHQYYNYILSEWHMVLWTFEELATLSVASPKLSDTGYIDAMVVSSVYPRIGPLTTLLSLESFNEFLKALIDIAKASMEKRENSLAENDPDVLDDSKFERKPSFPPSTGAENSKKDSISGKLISFAGKALLGDKGTEVSDNGDSSYQPMKSHRTKMAYVSEYRAEFIRRLTASKRGLRSEIVTKLPFSLLLMTDAAFSNTFRFKSCGKIISNHLCQLAGSCKEARTYAMDTLVILVTSKLMNDAPIPAAFVGPASLVMNTDPAADFFFAVKAKLNVDAKPETGIEEVSQEDLLGPLCDTIRTTDDAEVAESGLNALRSLLEGSGQNLSGDVWALVINAVSSLSGDASYEIDRTGSDWPTCCMLGFRCLKLIVDDFLEELPPPSDDSSVAPRRALLDCCSSFGRSRHDVNTSLTAIGLLWTIADQDTDTTSIDRALNRLVLLSSDSRSEVRNCSVNTLFSCVVGRGSSFNNEQWESCIINVVFGSYEQVLSRGGSSETSEKEAGDSSSGNTKYRVSIHHSRDSVDKQWATTEVLVIRGLSRVLRNYFSQLLRTTETGKVAAGQGALAASNAWFMKAWTRILGFALTAATQTGGRDTLDLRCSAVELLVLCCQLSCKAGIHAAITPARVGTNMEVVNGALRSVGQSKGKQPERDNGNKAKTELSSRNRERLFLEAFNQLGEFKRFLDGVDAAEEEGKSIYLEPVLVQVLHKMVTELAKLYECCKEDELLPVQRPELFAEGQETQLYAASDLVDEVTTNDHEGRFVNLIQTIAVTAAGDQGSRFLTQAQRASFDLLREMVSGSSNAALRVLAFLAGPAFFWVVQKDEGDEDDGDDSNCATEALGKEAAAVVSEEIGNAGLSDCLKVQILCHLLSIFVAESDKESWNFISTEKKEQHRKRSYRLFVPVMEAGLASAERLGKSDGDYDELLDLLWERVETVLSQMLAPIQIPDTAPYISQATHLAKMMKSTVDHSPESRKNEICSLLSSGAFKSMDIAKIHSRAFDQDKRVETKRRAKKRHDEALKMCNECVRGLCVLQPDSQFLRSITKQAFADVISSMEKNKDVAPSVDTVEVEIALIACQAIQKSNQMEALVISLFPQLCVLMSINHYGLRSEVASIMEVVNIGEALVEATEKMESAEKRAEEAEKENELLMVAIEELREENERLHRDIAVLSASSALT